MAYATKYRIEFDTIKNGKVKIDLQYDGFGGSVTNLKGQGGELEYADGDRSKLIGVKQSSLSFKVYCSTTIDPQIFLTNSDVEVKVLLYYNETLNWSGWLDSSNLQVQFKDIPSVDLFARDGLHLLESAKLQNLSDVDLWGHYPIINYLTYCLDKTELGLNFWTWIDIYPESVTVRGAGGDTTGSNDPLNQAWIYNTTFQTGARDSDNPLVVLQKICDSFKITCFQARGEWHFVYLEDWIRNLGLTGTQWNASGTALQYQTAQRNRVSIGLRESVKFINNDALVTYQKLFKSGQLNYSFDIPPALVRNIDLNDGTVITTVPGSYKTTDLKYWTYTGTQPLIYISLDSNDIEINRYIRIDLGASGTTRFKTASFPCNVNDKFKFLFNYTIGQFAANTGKVVWQVKVSNLSFTYYLKADGKWQSGGTPLFTASGFNSGSLSIENVTGIPITGEMEISLGFDGVGGGSTSHFLWDMSFTYLPQISDKFSAKGQFYKSEQTTISKLTYEEDVYLSESQNKVFQGALINATGISLANWKHRSVSESVRFGKLIMRALWKMLYRNFYRIEGTIYGATDGTYLLSPLNTILPDIDDTEFNVATLRVDLKKEVSEGTFVELLNTATTDDFDEVGTETFNFINKVETEKISEPKAERKPPPWQYGAIGVLIHLIRNRKKRS